MRIVTQYILKEHDLWNIIIGLNFFYILYTVWHKMFLVIFSHIKKKDKNHLKDMTCVPLVVASAKSYLLYTRLRKILSTYEFALSYNSQYQSWICVKDTKIYTSVNGGGGEGVVFLLKVCWVVCIEELCAFEIVSLKNYYVKLSLTVLTGL